MAGIELGGTLKALKGERAKMQQGIAKLEKAITALEGIFGATTSSNGHGGKRTLSAAARRKISQAQKLRWAKLKKQPGKK